MNVKNYRDLDHRFDSIMMQIIRITRAEQNLLRPEPVILFIVELGIYVGKNLLFGTSINIYGRLTSRRAFKETATK